jgi:hypothetical protein
MRSLRLDLHWRDVKNEVSLTGDTTVPRSRIEHDESYSGPLTAAWSSAGVVAVFDLFSPVNRYRAAATDRSIPPSKSPVFCRYKTLIYMEKKLCLRVIYTLIYAKLGVKFQR